MTVFRFEDLVVWQRSKSLAVAVHRVTEQGRFAHNFGSRDQVQRASISVLSNIAEGFERETRAEFARFLMIAKGSAGEVRSQLLAVELGYLTDDSASPLIGMSVEVTRMLVALRKSLRGPNHA